MEVLGANDQNLRIRRFFPKLSIVARGHMVKVIGAEEDIVVVSPSASNSCCT